jgi:predicted nucleotidyltransferase
MEPTNPKDHPPLQRLLSRLDRALGTRLVSAVLYGSAARGEFRAGTSDLNLLLVLADLEPATLEALSEPLGTWERGGQPPPRLLSPAILADAADVFPIEFRDLREARIVLHGSDPLAAVEVRREQLRIQAERELREKLMRLREAYVATHRHPRELRRLLATSYTTFTALFRGCLYLLGGPVPVQNDGVVAAFCERAGLDRSAFDEVERLRRGEDPTSDAKAIFARYYAELTRAIGAVDRFDPSAGGAER